MKRSAVAMDIDRTVKNDGEPEPKVVFVEREARPLGVALLNPQHTAKKSYVDAMELAESSSNVNTTLQANARNKLEIIGRQMQNLQELMTDVFEETKLSMELHTVACNFVKKPGHVYHLYERPSGQKYFGMLSPEEWKNAPHRYLGSFLLEADSSWTPARSAHGRYDGVNFLKHTFGMSQLQAPT